MISDNFETPRGMHVVRAAIARAVAGRGGDPFEFAAARWGATSGAMAILKADVGGAGSAASNLGDIEGARAEFLDYVRGLTAFNRLPAVRYVAKGVPVVTETGAAVASWRKQGQAAVVTAAAFDRTAMWPLSLHALAVFSNDTLRDQSAETEAGIMRTMGEAIAAQIDASAFDPTNAGVSDKQPAALSYGAASFASAGDVQADCENAFSEFAGALRTSVWIAHPKTLAVIGFAGGGKGSLTCDVGVLGGTLCGLPALPCEQLSADSNGVGPLVLLDSASVIACDEGATLMPSQNGMIEMADNPAMDSLGPTAPTGKVVSLFQTDSTALLAGRRINWRLARANACIVIEDCAYGAS